MNVCPKSKSHLLDVKVFHWIRGEKARDHQSRLHPLGDTMLFHIIAVEILDRLTGIGIHRATAMAINSGEPVEKQQKSKITLRGKREQGRFYQALVIL